MKKNFLLKDYKGDLTKHWYIYFTILNAAGRKAPVKVKETQRRIVAFTKSRAEGEPIVTHSLEEVFADVL